MFFFHALSASGLFSKVNNVKFQLIIGCTRVRSLLRIKNTLIINSFFVFYLSLCVFISQHISTLFLLLLAFLRETYCRASSSRRRNVPRVAELCPCCPTEATARRTWPHIYWIWSKSDGGRAQPPRSAPQSRLVGWS